MNEITRRSLLRTGATATAAVVIGVRPWDPAAAGAAGVASTPLRRSDYAGLVGTDFAVADAPQAAVLRLASVSDLARPALRGSEDAFSLTFSGDTPLDSGIHGLTHPELGSFDLFVSPVETADRHRYQAVIDRSTGVPSDLPAGSSVPTGVPGTDGAPAADGSGAGTGDGAAPAPEGSGAAQPVGTSGDPTAGAPAGDGSGAAQPSGTAAGTAPAAGRAAAAAKSGAASTPPRASAPAARRAAILQRATVRRLGRGARVEIALRASAHTVHVSLQRGGKSVVQGSHAVHDRHATVALRSAHHLPAGSYVLVVSAVDGTGSTLVQRRRIAVR
jgi:hypothetical protein